MENIEKLVKAFSDSLGIEPEKVTDNLSYGSSRWDSVAHMALVAAIESAFDIMMSTDDIVNMSSFARAREFMGKHGITFDSA